MPPRQGSASGLRHGTALAQIGAMRGTRSEKHLAPCYRTRMQDKYRTSRWRHHPAVAKKMPHGSAAALPGYAHCRNYNK
jgi:hypothetical protein